MLFRLSDLFTRSDREYDILRHYTDSCAETGHSYELRCSLPSFCSPCEAALGFFRTGEGYSLYVRPTVSYCGSSECLAELFCHRTHFFPSFRALTDQMRCWGNAMIRGDHPESSPCRKLQTALEEDIIGQTPAVTAAARRICAHVSKLHPARPLSLILHGPTGTGKTQLCKAVVPALARVYPAAAYQFVRADLNTFTEAHSVARLIGSPPGYIGYEDQPILEAVWRNPRTVFLFDELEKAHRDILKILMAILDEGRAAAHKENSEYGRELDFRRCIFLFTTNLDLRTASGPTIGFSLPPLSSDPPPRPIQQDETARQALIRSGVLREIAGRFTGFLPFSPLTYEHRLAITAKQIRALGSEFGLNILSVAPEIVSALTPADCLSVRCTVTDLEEALTPLFARHRAGSFHLCGTPSRMHLTCESDVC